MKQEFYNNKKVDFEKLQSFGFKKGDCYVYFRQLKNAPFTFCAKVFQNGDLYTEIIDDSIGEEYTLHLIPGADGEFVGKIRDEYEFILNEIYDRCFENQVFKSRYTYEVFAYVKEKYGTDPEYLWPKFPNNAVLRRSDSQKWYGAILTVNKMKLGFKQNKDVEVIDIHVDSNDIPKLIEHKNIYPGYHMNKKHWITIILDGSMGNEELFKYIDMSYELAKK